MARVTNVKHGAGIDFTDLIIEINHCRLEPAGGRVCCMGFVVRLSLVVLSAGLGMLVFPPAGWSAFAVLAWLPLLFALREAKPAHAFYLGLAHGVLLFGVTMAWLVKVFAGAPQMAVPLVLIMALFTALFARGYAVAQRRHRPGWAVALFAACWWLALEFYRGEIFYLKFPWLTPGVGLGPTCVSPVLGVYGASFLLILAAALVCQRRRHCLTGAVLMAGLLGLAVLQKNKPAPESTGVRVLAVQSEVADIDNNLALTRCALGATPPDIILWPEYALPFDVRKNERQRRQLLDLAASNKALVVVGTQTSMADGGWRNTALTLDKGGTVGEHHKNHTVHFLTTARRTPGRTRWTRGGGNWARRSALIAITRTWSAAWPPVVPSFLSFPAWTRFIGASRSATSTPSCSATAPLKTGAGWWWPPPPA